MNSSCSTPSPQEAHSTDNHPQHVRLFSDRYHLQRSRSPPRLPQGNTSAHVGAHAGQRHTLSSNFLWSEEGMSCWSDAATASTVLSLLHKEPLMPPPLTRSPTSEGDQTTRNRKRLTCTVCFGQFEDRYFPDSPITAGCDHSAIPESHICMACLRRSLSVQVSSSNTCAVTCPLCHERLSDEEVHRWASPQTFQAYDRMRTWQVLEEDAEFVTCIRPDCGFGQFHADGLEDPIVVCGSCGTRTCFIHRNTSWHEGLTCAEYEEMNRPRAPVIPRRNLRREIREEAPRVQALRRGWVNTTQEEFLSMRMIAEIAKPCPYCNAATEKIGGCKQITCGLCRQDWCWDCGIRWRRGHLDSDCSLFPPGGR